MEDVGQRQEDSGLALQLPLGALLVHQPPFLLGRREACEGRRVVEGPRLPRPGPRLTTASSSTLSTARKQPSNFCARARSARGGSCRGR